VGGSGPPTHPPYGKDAKIKKDPEFDFNGEYHVTFSSGAKGTIFHDKNANEWASADPKLRENRPYTSHHSRFWAWDRWTLIARLDAYYSHGLSMEEAMALPPLDSGIRHMVGTSKSGNFGHEGRPGQVGGSAPNSARVVSKPLVDPKIEARIKELADKLGDDLKAKKITLQNGTLVVSPTLQNDVAHGFIYPKGVPGYGKKGEVTLRVDKARVKTKSPESVLLHENGHAWDQEWNIHKQSIIKVPYARESAAYMASKAAIRGPGEVLGVKYYARDIKETVAQGVSLYHGTKYGVKIEKRKEFEQIFPETMKALTAHMDWLTGRID
jgi:hypothetical protein